MRRPPERGAPAARGFPWLLLLRDTRRPVPAETRRRRRRRCRTAAGTAGLPDYYISNRFKIIQRFKGKHLVTFESSNEWESLPQTLNLDINGNSCRQHIGDHAFYTHESAAYAFSLKGITISLEGGINGYWRSMNSELPELPEQLSGMTENVVHTNSFTVYATPKLEYWIKRVNLTLSLPRC